MQYDVVIVGGGAAGLSAALTLTRARRSVLVVDAGEPRNAPAGHVHGYLTRDGTPPGDLLAAGRAEVTGYGGQIATGRVLSAQSLDGGGFRVTLADSQEVLARRLLVTTGLVDELPEVPDVAERWGRDILHCPYCHGWEVRDQAIGILATGPMAVHQALMWRQWSADVTLFQHTAPDFGHEQLHQLAARGITVVAGKIAELEIADDRITGVRLSSGDLIARQAIVVAPRFAARADVLASLGLQTTELLIGDHVLGTYVPADPDGVTEIPGVWVAGNVADLRAQVISAAAAGTNAAVAINNDLIEQDTHDAVHQMVFDEKFWEERYSSHTAVWSGNPNPRLVTETADLTVGTALDVGSGEGADSIWLAERGWKVTAVDFSTTALQRGAAHAEKHGVVVDWLHADLTTWEPGEKRFDLVTAHFMHLPTGPRQALFARLADSVAPDGTLLIVGHHPDDMRTTMQRPNLPDLFFTAEQIADSLDPSQWEIVVATAEPRPATDPTGQEVTIHDAVLRARRRP